MNNCKFCDAPNQDGPVCLNCGRSLCQGDIMKLNLHKEELIKNYNLCYETLKRVEKSIQKGTYKDKNIPVHIVDLLDKLPATNGIQPIDVLCIAASISGRKLEHFYTVYLDSGLSLGDFVSNKILHGYDYHRLVKLSKLKEVFI
jgi:hypothetical protein